MPVITATLPACGLRAANGAERPVPTRSEPPFITRSFASALPVSRGNVRRDLAHATAVTVLACALFLSAECGVQSAELKGVASWYIPHSAFRTPHFTCASRFFPIGAVLRVTELHNGIHVDVRVIERGPALRFIYGRDGVSLSPSCRRIIDLSPAAFEQNDGLELGLASVSIREIRVSLSGGGKNSHVNSIVINQADPTVSGPATAPAGKLFQP